MAHAQPGRAAGEAPVGDEEDILAQSGTLDRPGDHEHLAHARAALGSLIANDDHVTRLDGPVLEGRHGRLLALEDTRRALEGIDGDAGVLDHGTLGCERAAQDRDPAGGGERILGGAQDLAVGIRRGDVGEVLRHGLACHREAVAVDETSVEQSPHDDGYAAHAIDVAHHVATEGLEVAQQRHLRTDAVEVLHVELDVRLVGDREQVQDGVGRSTESHEHRDGVFQRLARDDVACGDALADELDDSLAGLPCVAVTPAVDSRRRGGSGQRHAHGLGSAGHGVGGVHAAAGALARADRALDGVDVLA